MDKHALVSYYSLFVLEALMKNCGPDMHREILVKEVLGRMQDMVKEPTRFSEKSKDKCLELIQTWNVAFRHDSSYLVSPLCTTSYSHGRYPLPRDKHIRCCLHDLLSGSLTKTPETVPSVTRSSVW